MRNFSEYQIAQDLEKSAQLTTKVRSVIVDAAKYRIQPTDVEDAIRTISRRFNFPLKNKCINDYDDGKLITLMMPPDKLDLFPTLLPFIAVQTGNGFKCFVNLTRMMTNTKAGNYDIEPRTLYGLLQCGVIAREFAEKWNSIAANPIVLRTTSTIFSRCMLKLSDKLYGTSSDQVSADQVSYAFAKFFLIYSMERTESEATNAIALKACQFKTTEVTIRQVDNYIESYADPVAFYAGLAAAVHKLKNVTRHQLLSNFIAMYGTSTIFGFEIPSYFVAHICAAIVSAGLNAEARFELIAGKEGMELYTELTRIIR
jgi:hypothetical protein